MPSIPTVDCGDALESDSDISSNISVISSAYDKPVKTPLPFNTDDINRIEELPDEILITVLEQLDCYDYEDWEWGDARPSLRRLCMVSKKVSLIARPFLFKRIEIFSTRVLVKLYRAVLENQSLGEMVKEIWLSPGCLIPWRLMGLPDLGTEGQKLFDECVQLLGARGLQMSEETTDGQDLVNLTCHRLLTRTVNLSSLEMKIDIVKVEDSVDQEDIELRGLLPVGCAIRSAADGGAPVFLPLLKKLTMWRCRSLSVKTLNRVLNLPSLETLTLKDHHGDEGFITSRDELPELLPHLHGESSDSSSGRLACRNITALDLSSTIVRPRDMNDIAQLFPCLKVLSVKSQFWPSEVIEDDVSHANRQELSTILRKLPALRTLRLNLYPNVGFQSSLHSEITASLGPYSVLDLSELPNLQHLEVPFYMFAHMGGPAPESTIAIPRAVLPHSLDTLVLLAQHDYGLGSCYHGEGGEDCWDSIDAALQFLESLNDDLHYLPLLRTVAYRFDRHSCGDPFLAAYERGEDLCVSSRLRAIHNSFSNQNTRLLVQEVAYGGKMYTTDLEELEGLSVLRPD